MNDVSRLDAGCLIKAWRSAALKAAEVHFEQIKVPAWSQHAQLNKT